MHNDYCLIILGYKYSKNAPCQGIVMQDGGIGVVSNTAKDYALVSFYFALLFM